MKINQLLTIIVLIGIFGACTKQESPITTVHIQAKVLNTPSEYALIMEDYETVKDTLRIVDDVIDADIEVELSRIYDFAIKDQHATLYLTPGDSVSFSLDYERFDSSLVFSGSAQYENSFLLQKMMNRARPQFFADAKQQLAYSDSVYFEKIKSIENYLVANPETDPQFIENQKLLSTYSLAFDKLSYPMIIKFYSKKEPKNMDSSFYVGVDTLALENQGLINNWEYANFLTSYLRNIHHDQGKNLGSTLSFPQFIADTLHNSTIQDYTLSKGIRFSYEEEATQDSLIAFIQENVTTPFILKKLESQYNQIKSLRKGRTAIIWSAEDSTGVTHKLSDFLGKWIYMDVWASWCGPCIKEIPDLKALEEKYKDKNIAFVSISIDNNLASWKKALNKHELSGYQYVKPENENEKFMTDYMVDGVPSFYLIDPQGKIYTSNPPRPSNTEKFDELMTEIQQ